MADRLYKSRTDRVISGVAGGVAEQLDQDPSIVRVLWVVLAIVSGGIVGLVYLVMMIVVPEQPEDWPPAVASPPATPSETWVGPDGRPVQRAGAGAAQPASIAAPRVPARPRDPSGALVVGVILILLGAFFLLRQYVPQVDLGAVWPILAVAAGVGLVVLSLRPGGTPR
jgi:phage shock protein PspC (stress-responsive transcriptional regulator)